MSNRLYDSDETVGSDSDVTLPPDDRDAVNISPDLFDDSSNEKNMTKGAYHKKVSLEKRRSQVHEISDSESEEEMILTKGRSSKHSFKKSVTHRTEDVKLKRETSEKKDKMEKRLSDTYLPVQKKTEKVSEKSLSEKKRFMHDFLNMSDSDSDSSDKTPLFPLYKKDNNESRVSKSLKHEPLTKPSSTQKPYKKDFSRAYLSDVGKTENGASGSYLKKTTHIKDGDKHSSTSSSKYSSKNTVVTSKYERSSSPSNNSTLNKYITKAKPEQTSDAGIKSNNKHISGHTSSSTKELLKRNPNKDESRKAKDKPSSPSTNKTNIHLKTSEQLRSSSILSKPNNKALVNNKEDLSSPSMKTSNRSLIKGGQDRSESPAAVPLKRKHSRSPVPQELKRVVTEILNENTNSNAKRKKKPKCQYGLKCYRKNPSHLAEYSHGADSDDETPSTSSTPPPHKKAKITVQSPSASNMAASRSRSPPRTPRSLTEKYKQAQPYSFFFTKVSGIADKYNASFAMDIKDILSAEMGTLTASCQFNFMFDIPWLMKQYPPQFRNKPLLLVHGEQGPSKATLQAQAMTMTNIKFCQARLDIMYGTHHTKMMLLLYETGMRVVIHTANLIQGDWHQKTQGMWISPVFPRLPVASMEKGESETHFKRDLVDYISAYKAYQLKEWTEHIAQHDMSSARVVIIGSVPGRHVGEKVKSNWGHLKLRKVLRQHGPELSTVKTWPVVGQFSSIGSMGPNKENWLCGEWLQSLGASRSAYGLHSNMPLQLIFPSKDNVRLSLEGFPAGGSIPYTVKTAKKQLWLHNFFHVWKSDGSGRSKAMPHIKSYMRPTQEGSKAAWFVVTSANLSKAAWGALEKKGEQLMIRSYEIGVLFLPKFFDGGETFGVTNAIEEARSSNKLLVPYSMPTSIYEKKDRPWMWDIPYMDLPDTNGNIWCPFSK